MAGIPKQKGIMVLQRDRLFIYTAGAAAVYVMPFPPNVVNDLEVLNPDELAVRVKLLIDQNKVIPSSCILILGSTVLFDAAITTAGSAAISQEVKKFQETVPFESVLSKVYDITTKPHAYASNNDLYRQIQRPLEAAGFLITAVVPAPIATDLPQTGELTTQTAAVLLKKYDDLRKKSMVEDTLYLHSTNYLYQSIGGEKKEAPKNLPILIGIFVVLIGVLGALIMFQNAPPQKTLATQPTPPPQLPTVEPTAQPASSSSVLSPASIKIHILHAAPAAAQAEAVKQTLSTAGMTTVTVEEATVQAGNSLAVFSPSVSAELKDRVVAELKKHYPQISVQQADTAPYDVSVTITQ